MELPPSQNKTTKVNRKTEEPSSARKPKSARSRRSSTDSYFLGVPRTSVDCYRESTSLSDSCDPKKYQLRAERLSSNFFHISRNRNKTDESVSSQNELKPILKTNSGTVTLDSAIPKAKPEVKRAVGSGRFSYRLPMKVEIAPKKQVSFRDEADIFQHNSIFAQRLYSPLPEHKNSDLLTGAT